MNNKHQELIEEKVVSNQCNAGDVVTGWVIQSDVVRKMLQDNIDTVLEKEREQMLSTVLKIVDGHKVVYQKGDERFDSEAEDGDEKDHIDSSENETLDEVIESLNKLKPLDKTPPNKV